MLSHCREPMVPCRLCDSELAEEITCLKISLTLIKATITCPNCGLFPRNPGRHSNVRHYNSEKPAKKVKTVSLFSTRRGHTSAAATEVPPTAPAPGGTEPARSAAERPAPESIFEPQCWTLLFKSPVLRQAKIKELSKTPSKQQSLGNILHEHVLVRASLKKPQEGVAPTYLAFSASAPGGYQVQRQNRPAQAPGQSL